GLLDPLDDTLRSEILRYGQFVEAAYRSFDFDTSSPTFGSCKFSKNSLLTRSCIRETGYKPIKNLRATCGIQLPGWIDRGPSWVSTHLYTSGNATCPSLQSMVREEIGRVLEAYGDEPLSLTITGHSLGAALATLAAYDINSNFGNAPPVTVISFGGPRVGNQSFRCQLEKRGTKILRIVNSDDLITKVPGFVIENNDMAVNVAGLTSWVQKRVEEAQLVYADVGQELRLSSKECPHLSKGSVASCHELRTYLELVNGFVGSNCPVRATAKRVL
ncbi:hypothetical protein Golax_023842, partial [Gossypium laxum]|nr:hypothetical protein [Gossypium laxum]